MSDWTKGLVLFTAMLSPLALADWQLDIDFAYDRAGKRHTAQSSVSLVLGEETILFGDTDQVGALIAKAQLLEISEEEVKISLLVQEQSSKGQWRTIMSPVVRTGLNVSKSFDSSDELLAEVATLKVAITSV